MRFHFGLISIKTSKKFELIKNMATWPCQVAIKNYVQVIKNKNTLNIRYGYIGVDTFYGGSTGLLNGATAPFCDRLG
jgi:hypothetical protein